MPSGWVDEQKLHYHKNTLQIENLTWIKSQFTADLILPFFAKPLAQCHASSYTVFFPFSLPTPHPCFSREPVSETLGWSFLNDDPRKAQINPYFIKEQI